VITDIVGSTQAIEEGKYKEVNLLGACSIVTVLNTVSQQDIPFVFGGDGASMLIPPEHYSAVKAELLALQSHAQSTFKMTLRIGMVPVKTVIADGYQIEIAKFKVTPFYS